MNSADVFTADVIAQFQHRIVSLTDLTVLTNLQDRLNVVCTQTSNLASDVTSSIVTELMSCFTPSSDATLPTKIQGSLERVVKHPPDFKEPNLLQHIRQWLARPKTT